MQIPKGTEGSKFADEVRRMHEIMQQVGPSLKDCEWAQTYMQKALQERKKA